LLLQQQDRSEVLQRQLRHIVKPVNLPDKATPSPPTLSQHLCSLLASSQQQWQLQQQPAGMGVCQLGSSSLKGAVSQQLF
jgi:hypothetical protein